jgi:hypothetical protein
MRFPAIVAVAVACAVTLLVALAGCTRSSPNAAADDAGASAAPRAPATPAPLHLPEVIDGFASGPETAGAGFVRRSYARGRALISVTMARTDMTAQAYASWVGASTSGFPQAALDAPAGDANGFYQCNGDVPPSCDLLIQLRSGIHVEIRGAGTSSRQDADDVARGLPLRALAAPGTAPAR